MSGDLAPLRGISTTMGAGVKGALVLGARLLLLARDSATDIFFSPWVPGPLEALLLKKGSVRRGRRQRPSWGDGIAV